MSELLQTLILSVSATVVATIVYFASARRFQGSTVAIVTAVGGLVAFGSAGIASGLAFLPHVVCLGACGVAGSVFLYGAVVKSLSIEMLIRIHHGSDGRARLDDLSRDIIGRSFEERIEILTSKGLAVRTPGGFAITPAGSALAERIARVRAFLKVDDVKLYQ